jgi:preprotein translocase subunit SecY
MAIATGGYGGGGGAPLNPIFGGGGDGGSRGDKSLTLSLFDTLRLAWADQDLRQRLTFVLTMFAVYALGVHIQVPIPGVNPEDLTRKLQDNQLFQLINVFGGGALKRVSIFALGLNPYITASIIIQILTQAMPQWKQEMKEGGEYARRQQNRRTRLLSIVLCVAQSVSFISLLSQAEPAAFANWFVKAEVVVFWTAGAFFTLWLGEQISERGIGNGVSLMIFAGIIISLPSTFNTIYKGVVDHVIPIWAVIALVAIFLVTTWGVVLFTVAQRRIPIQHMRRTQGTRQVGGGTSYLPLSVNMAGVIPIIFAFALIYLPTQFAQFFGQGSPAYNTITGLAAWLAPNSPGIKGVVGCLFFTALIFFFTYFYTALQYNVEDIADNLKRGGSYIPGVRPGKQTSDFLNGVISRITLVGAAFLAVVALIQYIAPNALGMPRINIIGGTTLLILVSVALETLRQIEANLLMKRYGN